MDSKTDAWRTLKHSIEQSVKLEKTRIQLGDRDCDWYRVADPEQLLEIAAESDDPCKSAELDPFWAATWRAALGLDRFLARWDLADQRVLELGCGSGQAGVGAALRGARVTMTDVVPLALAVAELNARPVIDRVELRPLRWGEEQIDAPRFPIVIGSDLVYDTSLFPMLERCARQHLAPDGCLVLSEPHRHTGDIFAQWIRQAGWRTQEADIDLGDGRVPIRIFQCKP